MQLSAVSGLILWDQFYGSSQFPGSSVRLVLAPRGTILTSGWTVQNGVTSKMEIDCLGRRTQIHNYLRQEDREHSRQDDVQYRQRSTMRDEGHGRLFLETNADVSSRRAVAVVRLMRIEEGGAYADVLSGGADNSSEEEMAYVARSLGFYTTDLDSRDRKWVTDVSAGVIRWKRYLDFLVFNYSKLEGRAYDRMEPLLRQILRLSVYELVKLEESPHAVVNENVQLAKTALRHGAGNFVNGLLRALIRDKSIDRLPVPKVEGDERSKARALSTIHSHPVWIVRRWLTRYGEEQAVQLMQWNNARPTFCLRANASRGVSREDLGAKLQKLEVPHVNSSFLEDFVRVSTGMQDVLQAGLIRTGVCAVQDESAGLIVQLLDPQPGEVVIDCCAAPGGKTLFIATRLKGTGKVVAVDVNKGRIRLVNDAAVEQGVNSIVKTYHGDLRIFVDTIVDLADKVLLDAPCSGLGVLCKRADLRWNRDIEGLQELTRMQDELLESAASIVKPGGILVYSTCSIEPEENTHRVNAFLKEHPDFVVESAAGFVPSEMVTAEGFFASLPWRDQIDGAFGARLRRLDADV